MTGDRQSGADCRILDRRHRAGTSREHCAYVSHTMNAQNVYICRRTSLPYPPEVVRRRYDRLAEWYRLFEWILWLPRGIRARAIQRLELRPGRMCLKLAAELDAISHTFKTLSGRVARFSALTSQKRCWPGSERYASASAGTM
jgi:hypothetical protein